MPSRRDRLIKRFAERQDNARGMGLGRDVKAGKATTGQARRFNRADLPAYTLSDRAPRAGRSGTGRAEAVLQLTTAMPFKSQAQRRYMHARHPDIAERWRKESGPQRGLPERSSAKRRSRAARISAASS